MVSPSRRERRLSDCGGMENGAIVVLRMGVGPFSQSRLAEHSNYHEGRQSRDKQVSGPFAHDVHTHRFDPDGPSACYFGNHIEYTLPLGIIGQLGIRSFGRNSNGCLPIGVVSRATILPSIHAIRGSP